MNRGLLIFLVYATAGTAMAGDPLAKCAAAKIKAAGKKASGKLSCIAKGAAKPDLDVTACQAKPESKFSDSFTKADSKGACAGDPAAIESLVDPCIQHVVDAVPVSAGLEKCAGAKLKAGGKGAGAKLACYAKNVGKPDPSTLSACLQAASTKLTGSFGKADSKGTCPGDPNDVNSFTDSCAMTIAGSLPGKAPGCGNGVTEPSLGETCDDGNTVDGDSCPHDCHVDSCSPVNGSSFAASVTYSGPAGMTIAGLGVFVDYPEGKVAFPMVSPAFGVGNTTTDVGYGFNAESLKTTGLPKPYLHMTFEQCQGAPAPVAADFSCTVNDASDDQGNVVPNDQVTCTVTIP